MYCGVNVGGEGDFFGIYFWIYVCYALFYSGIWRSFSSGGGNWWFVVEEVFVLFFVGSSFFNFFLFGCGVSFEGGFGWW